MKSVFDMNIGLPELSLEELKTEAITYYNDTGRHWRLYGCDTFATDNHYTKSEIDEYSAPEWQPATFKSDGELINKICIFYLYRQSTFEEDEIVRIAEKIGAKRASYIINMAALAKIRDKYPHLELPAPTELDENVCEPVKVTLL
jgi:hypothetical protein